MSDTKRQVLKPLRYTGIAFPEQLSIIINLATDGSIINDGGFSDTLKDTRLSMKAIAMFFKAIDEPRGVEWLRYFRDNSNITRHNIEKLENDEIMVMTYGQFVNALNKKAPFRDLLQSGKTVSEVVNNENILMMFYDTLFKELTDIIVPTLI